VILYAPHITNASYSHGEYLNKVGYHCAEYFLKQPKRFADIPRGILAHSIHLYGQGSYDAATGTEKPRIHVTLATSIPQAQCCNLNLGYIDYRTINLEDWKDRESEGIKLIPHAGEILYRLKNSGRVTQDASVSHTA
jgi:lactate racemase